MYSLFFFANVCQTAGARDLLGGISSFPVASNTLVRNCVELMLDYIDTLDKLYITIMVFHSGFLLNAVSEYVPETFV